MARQCLESRVNRFLLFAGQSIEVARPGIEVPFVQARHDISDVSERAVLGARSGPVNWSGKL